MLSVLVIKEIRCECCTFELTCNLIKAHLVFCHVTFPNDKYFVSINTINVWSLVKAMVLLTENISMLLTQSHLSLACHIGQVTTFKGSDVIDLFTFFGGESKHKV